DGTYIWVTNNDSASNAVTKIPAIGGGHGAAFLAQNTSFTNTTSTNLYASNITYLGATGTGLSITGTLEAASSTVTTLNFTNATGASLTLSGAFSAGSTTVTTLNFTNATGSSVYANTGIFANLSVTAFNAANITWTNATGTNTTSTNLYASNITFLGATGTGLSITGTLSAASSTVTTLNFTNATGTSLYWSTAIGPRLTIQGSPASALGIYTMGNPTGLDYSVIQELTSRPLALQPAGGNVGIGNYTPTSTLTVAGDVAPGWNNANDLGTPSYSWRDVYASGTITGRNLAFTNATGTTLSIGSVSSLLSSASLFLPVATSSLNTTPRSIAISGRYAYITDQNSDRLSVYDLSNPQYPALVGYVAAGLDPEYVFVSGRYAYVSTLGGIVGDDVIRPRIVVIDVSNPSSPVITSSTSIGSGGGFAIQGKYAYVGDYSGNQLHILDLSSPSIPEEVGAVSTGAGTNPQYVAVKGRYAYVTGVGNSSLTVIDVSSSTNPVVTDSIAVGSFPVGIALEGAYAYVANSTDNTISIVNVGNPSNLTIATTTPAIFSQPWNFIIQGRYLYVVNYNAGISAVDITSSTNPILVTNIPTGVNPNDIAISGKYAYVVNSGGNSLSIIKIPGMETTSFIAGSAEIGALNILTNATISGNVSINSALNVGIGGIYANGPLGVNATSSMQTILPTISNQYDLGSMAKSWGNIYASGTIYAPTICLSGNCQSSWPAGSTTSSWYGPIDASNISWTNATGTNTTSTNLYTSNINFLGATGTGLSLTGTLAAASTTVTTLNFTNATGTMLNLSRLRIGTTEDFADAYGPHSLVVSGETGDNVVVITNTSKSVIGAFFLEDHPEDSFQFGTITDDNFGFFTNNGTPQVSMNTNKGMTIGTYANHSTFTLGPANGLAVSGSVGIGTSAPTSTLTVAGSFSAGHSTATSLEVVSTLSAASTTVTTLNFTNATGSSLNISDWLSAGSLLVGTSTQIASSLTQPSFGNYIATI
ncbi:MAG: hypothetical protein WC895_05220, partial [Candidatus Shapirobacteria bacterium]